MTDTIFDLRDDLDQSLVPQSRAQSLPQYYNGYSFAADGTSTIERLPRPSHRSIMLFFRTALQDQNAVHPTEAISSGANTLPFSTLIIH